MNKPVKVELKGAGALVVRGLKQLGIWFLWLLVIMVFTLLAADTGMRHAEEVDALRLWFYETRFGWLGWRLCLYSALGWGCRKIWCAPGFRQEYRRPFARICVVSTLFALLCEYSIFLGPGVEQ